MAIGRALVPALLLVAIVFEISSPAGIADSRARSRGAVRASHDLANACAAIRAAATDRFVAIAGPDSYRADRRRRARKTAFHLKPTGLGTYLLRDRGGMLLAVTDAAGVGRNPTPDGDAEWAPSSLRGPSFALRSTANGRLLAAQPATGALSLEAAAAGRRTTFAFVPKRHCNRFPEARTRASGKARPAVKRDGTVFGFADIHLHVTAALRAGGRVIHGANFDRFGISRALGGDARDHGPDGSLDVTGNLLRTGSPVGTHDTQGWPTFTGWPVHDTYTHQQAYYVWLKRAWRAGMRLTVAQTIEDEALCRLQPLRSHSCDETETIKLEIEALRDLQDYVDAQSGGRGRGWFRLVYSPRQARRVIARGKLAVVIGVESSSPLGCSEFLGLPRCTRAQIDRRLDALHDAGVRSMFITHWVDNAFAGVALQPNPTGTFIAALQLSETGHPFATEPCTAGDEADGRCNSRGLTDLGRYLVQRMIDKRMLIEVDHLSLKARASVLGIAERAGYPLVSSHTNTGGTWTPSQLARLYRIGGVATATPAQAPELAEKILALRPSRARGRIFGVPLGSDTGGFSALPGPRADAGADPLRYPFESRDGRVSFERQRTGEQVYDLNADGLAHYGLVPDLIADVQRQEGGEDALRPFFRSAEAYLQTWERAVGTGRGARPLTAVPTPPPPATLTRAPAASAFAPGSAPPFVCGLPS